MNIQKLREAQASFENRLDSVIDTRSKFYSFQKSFIKYFNENFIKTMMIDDYVTGKERSEDSFNFCYMLERKLDGLGRITGSPAMKFGIYYGHLGKGSKKDYYYASRFGNNPNDAFEQVRNSLLKLLVDGRNEDIDAIIENSISPMVKGKILSTYFPERYLNIFSNDHLNYYLIQLDLDNPELISSDPVVKREVLLQFKNNDIIMRKWSLDLFAHFLYTDYPGAPLKKQDNIHNDILKEYRLPVFPSNYSAEFVDLNIYQREINNRKKSFNPAKKDYEKEARKLTLLGDRGEKIVIDLEKKRLSDAGRGDLAEKVDRVSLTSDAYGYDILSFETDGTERHIEVKGTTGSVGSTSFFLTKNELEVAQDSLNYYIYIVYDVKTNCPKVWPIKNPFKQEMFNPELIPVKYRIDINTTLS